MDKLKERDPELPPFASSWKTLYAIVLAELLLLIILFYYLTESLS